jgi:hypothetical protein
MALLSDSQREQGRRPFIRVGPLARVRLLPREPRQGIHLREDREVDWSR